MDGPSLNPGMLRLRKLNLRDILCESLESGEDEDDSWWAEGERKRKRESKCSLGCEAEDAMLTELTVSRCSGYQEGSFAKLNPF